MVLARRLGVALVLISFSGSVFAQAPPASAASESIPNWTAPPYWTPPAAMAFEKLKESGVLAPEALETLPTGPLPFFAIQPCRIVDTRGGGPFTGAYGPPAMAANASRDFDLNSAPHCPGIPAGAEAYSLNVTVTETTGLGDIRLWPAGAAPAIPVSTQNWPTAGLSIANAAVVGAGAGGSITVYVAGSATHLIIDINGYYAPISIVNTVNGLSGAVTLAAGTNISITPAGNTLTIANTAPAPPAAWRLTGNSGTTPGTNFVGTTDNLALEVKVNGARALRLEPDATSPNVIGGSESNLATSGVHGATVAGGGTGSPYWNRVTDDYGAVGGGLGNRAGDNAGTTSDRPYAVVAGGNSNIASGLTAAVGGGSVNVAAGLESFVGGGTGNHANGDRSVVAGGSGNTADPGGYTTVAGGQGNSAAGDGAAVGGGLSNVANNLAATIPGGRSNSAAASYSFAAGRRAKAIHQGAFVWGDSTDADVLSTANNEFSARAVGGFRFYPSATVTCTLTDATGWQCAAVSDRSAKREFAAVDARETLARLVAMPIETWSYSGQTGQIRHMGPMAQDFAAAYGLGADDKTINPVDANGVALAAIQALYEMVKEKDAEIDALKARLSKVEAKVE